MAGRGEKMKELSNVKHWITRLRQSSVNCERLEERPTASPRAITLMIMSMINIRVHESGVAQLST
jgi:hypothetical protein